MAATTGTDGEQGMRPGSCLKQGEGNKEFFMAHPVDVHVGKRIRHRRWLVGMTQQQLA